MSTTTSPYFTKGLTPGHYFGLLQYKIRKFGGGVTAWRAFESWAAEQFDIHGNIESWTDKQGKTVIEAMKLLHDAPVKGQGSLL